MNVSLEDVIALLNELLEQSKTAALVPQPEVNKQYTLLGVHEGVKRAVQKIENHYGRERY